jgi:RNA polymerase sigma-70 factor (ECF subfamily)
MATDDDFERERPFLVQLAYRMLGSVQDAEDVVQETWVRWQQQGRPPLATPRAWFTRVCSHLCIDRLRAAERSGERYFGEWLPEPWVDPAPRRELDDTLSQALLRTLHRLSPAERAVFLLHDVFGYEFTEVGAMLELDAANCRQLAVRARQHLDAAPRRPQRAPDVERLGAAFFGALRDGDLDGLRQVLRDDVVLTSDGGGRATAVHYPLVGAERVLRFFDRVFVRTGGSAMVVVEPAWWNGAPGFLLRDASGVVTAAYQFELADGRIAAILVQRNPDKLRAFARRG